MNKLPIDMITHSLEGRRLLILDVISHFRVALGRLPAKVAALSPSTIDTLIAPTSPDA
jgi:hypothetical protein